MRFEISGTTLPVAVCYLEDGESVKAERDSMCWRSPNVEHISLKPQAEKKTKLPKGHKTERSPFKIYSAREGAGKVAFSTCFPGAIEVIDVSETPVIAQKHAFLACSATVETAVHFQKKLGGLFGGEGFVMQSFSGTGLAAFRFEGTLVTQELAENETMVMKTGCLAMMTAGCSIEIEAPKSKIKVGNKFLSAESDFRTRVTGPGKIWMQSLPRYVRNTPVSNISEI